MIQTTEIQCKTDSDRSKAIQSYASRMAARHPQYATMADKAAAIVERGGVVIQNRIQVDVTGDSGRPYVVQLDPDGAIIGCTCESFYYRPAVTNGRHYCKHIVAYLISENVMEWELYRIELDAMTDRER